jgi:ABC-type polysaccharide/polyol phosphate transport system, ATPase component
MSTMSAKLHAYSVGLDIPVFTQDQRSARATLSLLLRAAFQPPKRITRTLLSGIDFQLQPGDRLGVVGRNGSGKSTLLKVLVGAYTPSRGELVVTGERQGLLNLSLGFNPEATIVENIILRGIAMGLKASKVESIIDEVLDFAELAEKAGHRLRTLSSGQRMRLGFALATAVRHEILIMDEWLGTGDASFIEKAKVRIHSHVESAQIVVLASHSFPLLRSVCNKAILLEGGEMKGFGSVDEILEQYAALLKTPVAVVEEAE